MKPNQLTKYLIAATKANVPVHIWGPGGTGKSSIVKQLGKTLGMPVVDLRPATQDPGDLIGMPMIDEATQTTIWAKPEWWLEQDNWILFIDELNRGTKEVTQCMFQLVNDRMLHTHQLPPGVRIIAAGNPPTGSYDTEALDKALCTRFAHVTIDVDPTQWIDNCSEFINKSIINYIAKNPDALTSDDDAFDVKTVIFNTPRTWEFASRFLASEEASIHSTEGKQFITTLVSSCVGPQYAMDFILDYEKLWTSPIDLLDGKVKLSDIQNSNLGDDDLRRLSTIIPLYLTKEFVHDEKDKPIKTRIDNFVNFLVDLLSDYPDQATGIYVRLGTVPGVSQDVKSTVIGRSETLKYFYETSKAIKG